MVRKGKARRMVGQAVVGSGIRPVHILPEPPLPEGRTGLRSNPDRGSSGKEERSSVKEETVMSQWHEQALLRFGDAITERFLAIALRHFVDQEYVLGWLDWFGKTHPELFAKYCAAEEQVNTLALEGRTDSEAQRAFNDALRVWRDGACWAVERYIEWKKQREAEAQAVAARVGRQEELTLGR
jgi:hypothetical protein